MGWISDIGSAMTGNWGALAGDVVGAAASAFGAHKQQQASQQMASTEMAFQERMSDTAMQRRVADLRAAGLNPLLAIGQGGASSPGGAMGQSQNIMGAGISGAQVASQIQNTQADTRVKNANAALTEAQTPDDPIFSRNQATTMTAAKLNQVYADTGVARETIKSIQQQIEANVPGWQAESIKAQIDNFVAQNPGLEAGSELKELDVEQMRALLPSLIQASKAANIAAAGSAQAQARFNDSIWGRIFHAIVGTSSPTNVGSAMGQALSVIK